MSDGIEHDESGPGWPGMRLLRFELHNWGTFDRQVWRLDVAGGDTLLTGNIGSGKSTIVDGLSVLFNPPSAVSFNLAAGAERRERSLRTYVLGACRNVPDEVTGGSRPQYLRNSAGTTSTLLAVFGTNRGRRVSIGMMLRFVNEAATPNWTYLLADDEITIADDLSGHRDVRDQRQQMRARGIRTYPSYAEYARDMTRALGLRSPAALALFNQTVAMKSVGNLTEFVRRHMLDAPDITRAIDQMLAHYADLTRAHDLVVDARRQIAALDAVATGAERLDALETRLAANAQAAEAIVDWVNLTRLELLADSLATNARRIPEREAARADVGRRIQGLETRAQDLRFRVRAAAGADLALAENDLSHARSRLEQVIARRRDLQADAEAAQVEPPQDAEAFARFTGDVAALDADLARRRDADLAHQGQIVSRLTAAKEDLAALDAELASASTRSSNIPVDLSGLRDRIAESLGLPTSDLPFAGELIRLADGQQQWEAAIERLVRPFALSLLVPQDQRDAVAAWVDGHHLGQRLMYYPVPAHGREQSRPVPGTVATKLVVRPGTQQTAWVIAEVGRRFQHVCVEEVAQLADHERAVTRAGQIRDGLRREKDDRSRIDDRRRYVLGWDTTSRRQALAEVRPELQAAVEAADAELRVEQQAQQARRAVESAVARLLAYRDFAGLDAVSARAELDAADAHLQALRSNPEVAQLTADLQSAEAALVAAREDSDRLTGQLSVAVADAQRLQEEIDRIGTPVVSVTDAGRALLEEAVQASGASPTRAVDCDGWQARITSTLMQRSRLLTGQRNGAADEVVAAIGRYAAQWPVHVVEIDTSRADSRAELLARRQVLLDDDLPRFEREFRDQLQVHAINNIAVFARRLETDAQGIATRISAINQALAEVDYQAGTVIALTSEHTRDLAVREFRRQLLDITTDVTGDPYSEDRFLAVRELLDRFAGRPDRSDEDARWTRHVADVRNWFSFAAEECTREEGAIVERYSDSDGKSGGQKERLAYTILAASLAYQYGLADPRTRDEAFRFAMIDEAFGRGSDDSTRFGLEMFDRLGLQLLVVTPLQKTHTIEGYVQAVGYVDQREDRSRLLSMTIEEFRDRRHAHLGRR